MPSKEESYSFIVPDEISGQRADKVLAAHYQQFSRSQIQRLFKAGRVWRENAAIAQKQKIYSGDLLTFSIPAVQPLSLRPVPLAISVLYEDEHLIVINKAAGMVIHPGCGTGEDTLVHALLHHCQGKLSRAAGEERPGIVHRLDVGTSGAIVAAKTDTAFFALTQLFAQRQVKKEYLAWVWGVPKTQKGSIKEPIGRHPIHRTKMAVDARGRFAHSDWECIKTLENYALLRVRIHTGRTHQIRVHLSYMGHPILGDTTYGNKAALKQLGDAIGRPLLHAYRLTFEHPITGTFFEQTAPLPSDFEQEP